MKIFIKMKDSRKSLLLTIPRELLEKIFIYLDLDNLVAIKKLHPFTDVQHECDRIIKTKQDITRVHFDTFSKNYIKETLYFLAKDLNTVINLPDPFYIQNVFSDRDNEIKEIIPKIDYSNKLETILYNRIKYDKEFNDFYEQILRFYKSDRCNTFPTHPVVISLILDKSRTEFKLN